MPVQHVNLVRCVVAAFLLPLVVLAPILLGFFLNKPSRRAIVMFLFAEAILSAIILLLPLWSIWQTALSSGMPGFTVGPSWMSIRSLTLVALKWLWLPAITVYALLFLLVRCPKVKRIISRWFTVGYAVVASLLLLTLFYYGGFAWEDSTFADSFTKECFERIDNGMLETEVYELLGVPLRREDTSPEDIALIYAQSMRSGWNAVVNVGRTNSMVISKTLWWSD